MLMATKEWRKVWDTFKRQEQRSQKDFFVILRLTQRKDRQRLLMSPGWENDDTGGKNGTIREVNL